MPHPPFLERGDYSGVESYKRVSARKSAFISAVMIAVEYRLRRPEQMDALGTNAPQDEDR
jgi:hypothetical protein